MSKSGCVSCQKTKANYECGLCHESVCKSCAQFVPEDRFAYMGEVPADLAHTVYCPFCFDAKITGPMEAYDRLVDQAKDVLVFERSQSKETRFIKRIEDWIEVKNCVDREDVLMRLAFHAARGGFNGVVDVQVNSAKVQLGKYQSSVWSGRGTPAQIDPSKLMRDRALWQNPN